MYEEYLEKVREECLIRNRSSRTADIYVKNIAISNRRIVSMTNETVTYLVKDYKNGGKYIQQTITFEYTM